MSKVEYFIGGGADKGDFFAKVSSPSEIMKAVFEKRKKDKADIFCIYEGHENRKASHENRKAILKDIQEKWQSGTYTSIRLTGHSWGGDAAMNLVQDLYKSRIPVDELITLDPVSMFPFAEVNAKKWVNVYLKPSLFDQSIGKIPIIGNLVVGVLTMPTLVIPSEIKSGYIANLGGQLGYENGAHNVEMGAEVAHAHAQKMYDRARIEMKNARHNPRAIQ